MNKPSFRRIAGACLVIAPFVIAYQFLPFELFRVVATTACFMAILAGVVILVLSSSSS